MKAKVKEFRSEEELEKYLLKSGNTPQGAAILKSKGKVLTIEVEGIDTRAANILKQDAISVGGDCCVPRKASSFEKGSCSVLLMVTRRQLERLLLKLKSQPFGLKEVSKKVEEAVSNYTTEEFKLSYRGKELDLKRPKIMGVLNVTPDSFSDGGLYIDVDLAVKRCEELLLEGASIVDIGGESTRPGSEPVPLEEELKRVIPVIEEIRKRLGDGFLISIDTYKSKVAEEALNSGADIVNDISGFHFDGKMADVVAKFGCPAVITHIKGTPKNMQENPAYEDVVSEIFDYFEETIRAVELRGVKKEQLIVDPGIGFGKRVEDNLCILKRLNEFRNLGLPVLIGASRKSFIGAVTGEKNPVKRLPGSLAAAGIAVLKGAKIVRVHDVKETKQFLDILLAVEEVTC